MQELHKRLIGLVILGAIPAGMAIVQAKHPGKVAETSSTHSDPKLRTRYYPIRTTFTQFAQQIEALIPQLKNYGFRWKLVPTAASEQTSNFYKIQAEVPVFFFTDDLEVRLRLSESGNGVVVDIRSAARVGKSDLGENRRHVLQLLAALDKQFGPS
jgi:uncharacterized protein (DUF1499 family)